MDIIEGLPLSDEVDTILVVIDRLTKFGHYIAIPHPYTALEVAAKFVKEVIGLHEFSTDIVSDRDKVFMSIFQREKFRLQQTYLLRSTAFHPPTYGQSVIVNKMVETYLRCFANEQPKKWAQWLHWAEFSYNTSPHLSIKMSPFQALYGTVPPHVVGIGHSQTTIVSLEHLLQERNAMLDELQFNMAKAQQRMKYYANMKRKDVSYEEGEWVYLKVQPYRQKTWASCINEKLSLRFYGPYKILQKVGRTAYKILQKLSFLRIVKSTWYSMYLC